MGGDLGWPPASAFPRTHPAGATPFLVNEANDSSQHSLGKDGTHKPFYYSCPNLCPSVTLTGRAGLAPEHMLAGSFELS